MKSAAILFYQGSQNTYCNDKSVQINLKGYARAPGITGSSAMTKNRKLNAELASWLARSDES
jgi:hypothetical protein